MIRNLLASTFLTTAAASIAFPAVAYPAGPNQYSSPTPLEAVLIEMDQSSTAETSFLLYAYQQAPQEFEATAQSICQGFNAGTISPQTFLPVAADIFSEYLATFPSINPRTASRVMVGSSVAAYCPGWISELTRY